MDDEQGIGGAAHFGLHAGRGFNARALNWMLADPGIYAGLFIAAFVSATMFPGQSEAILVGLLTAGYPVVWLVVVASAGNILGSVLNWGIGRGVERFRHRRWFPVRDAALERAQGWYQKYGKWSLLLSWAPVVGDPLTIAAGVMREPFPVFLLLVAVAKTGRYIVLVMLAMRYIG
jgi:membrane protein YqaA with SNARE-associated domain